MPTTTTTTTTLPVCVDTYANYAEGKYVKSVVKYAYGKIEQNAMHFVQTSPHQELAFYINQAYKQIVGRNAEKAGMDYYYGMYQNECTRQNLTFNPNGVYLSIINDNIKPGTKTIIIINTIPS